MKSRTLIFALIGIGVIAIALIGASLILTPTSTNPAFDTALRFVEAAAAGDEATAIALVSEPIRAYAAATCPDGRISACVDGYTPPEWGDLERAVYRRATPNGAQPTAWDIDIISYYTTDTGASGVCITARAERQGESDTWLITRYAGFVHCGDPGSRNMANNPAAPNVVPPPESDAVTSGAGLTVTDEQVITPAFTVNYPAGWRVITSAAAAPLTVTLVMPGDCGVIVLSLAPVTAPDLPDCGTLTGPLLGEATFNGITVYATAIGQAADAETLPAIFQAVVQDLTP